MKLTFRYTVKANTPPDLTVYPETGKTHARLDRLPLGGKYPENPAETP